MALVALVRSLSHQGFALADGRLSGAALARAF